MRRTRSIVLAAVVVAVALVATPAVAAAHVTVQPPTAAQGSYAKLTFRVPNERPDAATVELRVQLPQDHPFASVSVKPLPGWTAKVDTRTLDQPIEREGRAPITEAPSTITWSGGRIEPGQFQEFEISVGPLPTDVTTLSFPAIQTYSSGEEVAWIQVPETGQPEPERPAPTLTLTPAASAEGDGHDSASSPSTTEVAATSTSDDSDSSTLAVVAVVLGGVALVLAAGALVVTLRGRDR